jgi:nucleotidyltransferase substrate binding protein (TIGR01987 family)
LQDVIICENIIITPLLRAQKAFEKALPMVSNDLERDGAIQRFEFTYELLWKTLKKVLLFKGIEQNSPRGVFREAAKIGMIEDLDLWFDFLKNRNITVHIYKEEYAEIVFSALPVFSRELRKVIAKLVLM